MGAHSARGERLVAVDWSGALTGAGRKIWVAEVEGGALAALSNGRDRDATVAYLEACAARHPELVVGLDFAFSFPRWFLDARRLASAPALWTAAAAEGEGWLARGEPPFWGRAGRPRPPGQEQLRRTEREIGAIAGVRPKSAFQIGGAGAVGTGSIRGMPALRHLRARGFRIWPFDAPAPGRPLVIEIYPRLLTGAVNKGSFACRVEYLRDPRWPLDLEFGARAASSDDAFDATVSALVMSEHAAEFGRLPAAHDETTRLEGAIWVPAPTRRLGVAQRSASGRSDR